MLKSELESELKRAQRIIKKLNKQLKEYKDEERENCMHCDGTGKGKEFCGGSRYDMWLCGDGSCGKYHAEIECIYCK